MKDSYTHISVILDRSGSMESIRGDTIGGFNSFLADQNAQPGEATLTLVQFDDRYETACDFERIGEVKPLTSETFVPRGLTALLDAIGRTVNETGARLAAMPESQRPAKVLLVIITDGQENSSREFNHRQVFDMLKQQQERYGWAVTYLGANQDAIAVGGRLGIAAGACLTTASNSIGTHDSYKSLSRASSGLRGGELTSGNLYNDADRAAQVAAGAT